MMETLKNLVRRVKLSRSDSPGAVQVQGLGDQALEAARFLPWGFASQPVSGGQALVVFVGGSQSAPVVLGEEVKGAPASALASGEVMLYAQGGASVHLKANGNVLVQPGAGGKIEIGGEGLPMTAGVVTGECACAFTGAPHPEASQGVLAKKEG